MAQQILKSDLPTVCYQRVCPVCDRPFTWHQKCNQRGADCWDEVKYCSERCRRRRNIDRD